MSELYLLVGLPASGKSTYAKQLTETKDVVILSSDEIRKELFGNINHQNNNADVFKVMNDRAEQLLSENKNVVYDSTNINRKRRRHLINHVLKADKKTVYYFNQSIKTIKYRNERRSRKVPEHVIDKMYKNLHIPIKNEGWDNVVFVGNSSKYLQKYRQDCESLILDGKDHDTLFSELSAYIPPFDDIYDLPQDSSYHSFSVSRHTYHVYLELLNNYNKGDRVMMLWAGLFHDIGKAFCKSFVNYKEEETKYASFIGHEYISSQIAATYLDLLGYDDKFIKSVVALVQFHMMPMKAGDKKMWEVKGLLGDRLFDRLMVLHGADKKAK